MSWLNDDASKPESVAYRRRDSILQEETPLYNDEDADRPFSIFYGVKCDEFVKDQNVILLPADCSIKKAVSTLSDHGVSSAPVVDAEGHYVRVIDFKDLAQATLHFVKEAKKVKLLTDMNAQLEHLLDSVNVGIIPLPRNLDFEKETPFYFVFENDDLTKAVKIFIEKRIHRLCVLDHSTRKVKGMISQSNIVRYLTARLSEPKLKERAGQTLRDLGLDGKQHAQVIVNGKALGMVTVPAARSVMDALTIMYTQHCSSIAVVDTNGLFVGALYFSHIKYAFKQRLYSSFTKSCGELLSQLRDKLTHTSEHKEARPDVMTPASTLEDAMYTVVENHVHRVFVVEDKKPVGVVSLTDIILQFKGQ